MMTGAMRPMPMADEHLLCISAVTLAVAEMGRSVVFYRSLGFAVRYGGGEAAFTSLTVGDGFVNLQLDRSYEPSARQWGRVILWVDDVDAVHARAVAAGHSPEAEPVDAPWGERYFHLDDPDHHQLSFARPLSP